MSLQSGDVVLVTRRAHEIFRQFQMKTTCVVVKKKFKTNRLQATEYIDYLVTQSQDQINSLILSKKPKLIIFFGTKSYAYIPAVKSFIKKSNIAVRIYLDIQGALEESYEYANGSALVKGYCKFLLSKAILTLTINNLDGALVVSDELGEYCRAHLLPTKRASFQIQKIRCGLIDIFSSQQKEEWRKEVRATWGIDQNTHVFVFSGYRMPWQNIEKTILTFQHFDKTLDNVFFAFFCNIDDAFSEKLKKSFPQGNYRLAFLKFDEYFENLCACDVGFLIRDYNTTNHVAFPNKFSDYLNAGLMLAINKALPEPTRLLEQYQVPYVDVDNDLSSTPDLIQSRADDRTGYYQACEHLCTMELLYSNQIKSMKW